MCDNLDCWNLVEVYPYRANMKHHFCNGKCMGMWERNDKQRAKIISEKLIGRNCEWNRGENNPSKRPEVRAKMSKNHADISGDKNPMKRSEVKAKFMGENNCMKRPEIKEKHKKACAEKNSGINNVMKRPEVALKVSLKRTGQFCGDKNPNWKGGISFEPYCPKWTPELRERIRAFFDYECVICGKTQEDNVSALDCHHVEYDKMACCDGQLVQFASLCDSCHGKMNGDRQRWMDMLHVIIHEVYDDRSYFTRDEWKEIMEYNTCH